jgi:hypothetical protein
MLQIFVAVFAKAQLTQKKCTAHSKYRLIRPGAIYHFEHQTQENQHPGKVVLGKIFQSARRAR